MSDNRTITFAFYLVFGLFILLLLIVYFVSLPLKSRASAGTITIKIQAQGNHKDNDQLGAQIDFYNGPDKVYEEPNATFTYLNNTYTTDIVLPSDFNYQDRYALFIKPEKHQGRIFCTTQVTGSICTVPQFIFFANGNSIDLSPFLSYAGDVLPANGKIDALDMSLIMKDLGKTALEAQSTDLNNDQIVDVVDYSLALYSLSHNISDDQIKLIAPPPITSSIQPITPTDTASPSPTLASTPTPSPSVAPSPIVTPTLLPSPTPLPTATPIPRLGKDCVNGTDKITQSINSDWELNVLPIPYRDTNSQYRCVPAEHIVLHWSGSSSFRGNGATWGTLNTRNRMCGLAIDNKEILQMSNFYDDKVTWEGCSALDNAINIEINGTQFDLWYNKAC